jgi:vitamin B12 transport system ATP-binding protein
MTLLMQLTDVAEKGRLEPMSAAINAGEILHLVGPNGAGKSTLLARIAGLTTGQGEITLLGHSLAQWSPVSLAHRRGYLVQQQVRHLRCRSGTILRCICMIKAALHFSKRWRRHWG